jgi:glutamine amidotransferase
VIAVIDAGVGNVGSVTRWLERENLEFVRVKNACELIDYKTLILCGVSSLNNCVSALEKSGFMSVIRDVAKEPSARILGICLGMHLCFSEGSEGGISKCLDLLEGNVIPVGEGMLTSTPRTNVGWRTIESVYDCLNEQDANLRKLVGELNLEKAFFCHSFAVNISSETVLKYRFGTRDFSAVHVRNNVMGVQFHPEKSGRVGTLIADYWLRRR